MRLVMTLRTRDHADVVEAHLAFHRAAGVDYVIATDHRSRDGTREILQACAEEGWLELRPRDDERYLPGRWLAEMAARARELAADWVIHADCDEFFWPRGGDLKEVLRSVPPGFDAVFCLWRHFLPRPEDGAFFAERMTVRLASHGPWTRDEDPFHPQVKVAHRGAAKVALAEGAHDPGDEVRVLRGWYPIEVLHFPLRSEAQAEAKTAAWAEVLEEPASVGKHVRAAAEALAQGRFRDRYRRYVVDDAALEQGLAAGTLAVDTRLRDALRALAGASRAPLPPRPRFLPAAPASLQFPALSLAEEAALAADASCLPDSLVRLRARVERLEQRLRALEAARPKALLRGLAARASRWAPPTALP